MAAQRCLSAHFPRNVDILTAVLLRFGSRFFVGRHGERGNFLFRRRACISLRGAFGSPESADGVHPGSHFQVSNQDIRHIGLFRQPDGAVASYQIQPLQSRSVFCRRPFQLFERHRQTVAASSCRFNAVYVPEFRHLAVLDSRCRYYNGDRLRVLCAPQRRKLRLPQHKQGACKRRAV